MLSTQLRFLKQMRQRQNDAVVATRHILPFWTGKFCFISSDSSGSEEKMITLSTLTTSLPFPPARPTAQSDPEPVPEPQPRKFRGSAALKRWSATRAIRSGRKLDRPSFRNPVAEISPPVQKPIETQFVDPPAPAKESDNEVVEWSNAKSIYIISDGTGWTAEHAVNAALGQFDYCLVDRGCPVNTHLFSGIDDAEKLMQIIQQAAKEGALVLYTLADPSMSESAKQACKHWGIPSTDILGPITDSIATHLGVSPSGLPRGVGRTAPLSDEYFRRIEAMEFTIKHDDGACPENLHKADIVLAGVSRSGKTPLSIYLAQKGYKVANVPIVMGIKLPDTLFTVDPEKVFGLTINPTVLQAIRRSRVKTLGFTRESRGSYSEMDHVRQELEHARKVFAQNPAWPVIEVTGKAIEETAAVILRLYHDRKNKQKMPAISKRY